LGSYIYLGLLISITFVRSELIVLNLNYVECSFIGHLAKIETPNL